MTRALFATKRQIGAGISALKEAGYVPMVVFEGSKVIVMPADDEKQVDEKAEGPKEWNE